MSFGWPCVNYMRSVRQLCILGLQQAVWQAAERTGALRELPARAHLLS